MNSLTMKHLRYFDALDRHRHFGRAAEDCAISQPALSMQVRELEALLGAALVERGARTIRLTPLGEAFAARARLILREVEGLGELARAAASPFLGRLRIGVIPTIAPYLLPALVQALGRAYPGLELAPREAMTSRLLADLAEGRLDCAILALPVPEPTLEAVPLFEEEFLLVRPLSEARAPVPGPARLREMRLLLLEEGHCFRDQAIALCNLDPGPSRELMEGSSLSTLVQMVGAEIGVTLIPEMAVRIETRSAPVAVSRLRAPRPSRMVGMVWRRTTPLDSQLRSIAGVAAGLRDHVVGAESSEIT